jgi:hypothetical protein
MAGELINLLPRLAVAGGSGTDFFVKTEGDDSVVVYDVNEEREQARTKVFQGTMQEAAAYIERRRAEGESFLIPGLVIVAGVGSLLSSALLVVMGGSASRRAERNGQR